MSVTVNPSANPVRCKKGKERNAENENDESEYVGCFNETIEPKNEKKGKQQSKTSSQHGFGNFDFPEFFSELFQLSAQAIGDGGLMGEFGW